MLDALKDLAPWTRDLALLPKVAITIIVILFAFVFLYVVWVPTSNPSTSAQPGVQKAYERLVRVLDRIEKTPSGRITVDGVVVPPSQVDYYVEYQRIAEYIQANPGNIEGVYETIWENGGGSRAYTSDTHVFEAVVGGFFHEWELARGARSP